MSDTDSDYNPENDFIEEPSEDQENLKELTQKMKFHKLLKTKRTNQDWIYLSCSESEDDSWNSEVESDDHSEDPEKEPKKENKPKKAKKQPKKEKKAKKQKKAPKKPKCLLDPDFKLSEAYFFDKLKPSEENRVAEHLIECLNLPINQNDILSYLKSFPSLKKAQKSAENIKERLKQEAFNKKPSVERLTRYNDILEVINGEFYSFKPTVFEWHFFPNKEKEITVSNMIRTCKKTLDIAIFTFTNNSISAAVKEAHNRGVKVRLIADDEQAKAIGADVYVLASENIPVKTDDSKRFHMHHKFAVLDKSVVLTGSFNYTAQAVKYNQENILFIENKEMALSYTEEFDRLWNTFQSSISKEEGERLVIESEKRVAAMQKKRKESIAQKKALKSANNAEFEVKRSKGKKVITQKKDKECSIF